MGHIEKTVFISYRRTNVPWALAVYKELTPHGYDVFIDYSGVASDDFERVIVENIRARAHFLVLLTPSALERILEPGDWLRREIECAMDERRNVVPLFLEGCDIGATNTAKLLEGRLAALRRYDGLSVPVEYFDAAMDKLRSRYLSVPIDVVLHPASAKAVTVAAVEQRTATAAPTVAPDELTAIAWFEKGFTAVDPEEKARCYTEAIRLNPDYPDAYFHRGVTRQLQGDLDGAVADSTEVLRLDPEDADTYYFRALLHEAQGDFDGALADSTEALRLRPDDAATYYIRARVRTEHGDFDGAVADSTEALRLRPDDADTYYIRARVREAQGDLDGALADYEEALRLDPENAAAHYNRGNVRQAQGDYGKAIRDFEKYLELGGGRRDGDQAEVEAKIRDLRAGVEERP